MNLIELSTKNMGILYRNEFRNFNCSTIIEKDLNHCEGV